MTHDIRAASSTPALRFAVSSAPRAFSAARRILWMAATLTAVACGSGRGEPSVSTSSGTGGVGSASVGTGSSGSGSPTSTSSGTGVAGLTCVGSSWSAQPPVYGQCAPLLGTGAPCTFWADCQPDLYCLVSGSSGTCVARNPAGAACTSFPECVSSSCTNGLCDPVCHET